MKSIEVRSWYFIISSWEWIDICMEKSPGDPARSRGLGMYGDMEDMDKTAWFLGQTQTDLPGVRHRTDEVGRA